MEIQVCLTGKSIVKASNHSPKSQAIALSNLDLLSGRFPVTYLYFYDNPQSVSFASIMESLKKSLAENLSYYYPFAGRIVENPATNEPEIICDNNGALVLEGYADICLKKLDFYNLNKSFQGNLLSINPDFPMQLQVIHYTCGGISITFTFDHALGDASSFGKFLLSWSDIAQNKQLSCLPDHRRNLHPRYPPGLMLPYIVLGRGGPAIVLSSGRRFPVAELNFGFGSPALGTVSSTVQKIGVGYLNQRPSARGDGSWTVSAILWPELAAALESDSIFEPMSASHLLL